MRDIKMVTGYEKIILLVLALYLEMAWLSKCLSIDIDSSSCSTIRVKACAVHLDKRNYSCWKLLENYLEESPGIHELQAAFVEHFLYDK